jgi:hypothetical protein
MRIETMANIRLLKAGNKFYVPDQVHYSTQLVNYENDPWTLARLRDEFFLCLTRVRVDNKPTNVTDNKLLFLDDLKYYAQAKRLIYWIPITRPPHLIPAFIINLSDLTARIKKEFEEFVKLNNKKEIAIFLKEIAVKFFEAINYVYTYDSVIPHIVVGIE